MAATRKQADEARKAGIRGKAKNPGGIAFPSQLPEVFQDLTDFAESWKQKRFYEFVGAAAKASGKISVKIPQSGLSTGQASERIMQQALGWYWEPLLHDLAFFEEMRDSVALFDGQTQKLVDLALDGFKIQCSDPQQQADLSKALLDDPNVNFRETLRASMVDLFSLGNAYRIPIWKRDDKGRLVPKTFKPVRATAMRKLRDEDLATEGYVQLLHRPSEFIMGPTPPSIPTIWNVEDVLCGIMRSYGWYAYGKPLFSSSPFILRLKLTMERDLAEMLHQHVPRIDVTYTPDEQMNQEQVDAAMADAKAKVADLKPSDNFLHTPDTTFEYKGPAGKGLDFNGPQNHTEDQLFYVLPFAQSIMGKQVTENPYASQQHWKLSANIANSLRFIVKTMFAPALEKIAEDWGIDDGIVLAYSELDPESSEQNASAEELHVNNAVLKRDNGFIDQDTAARQATKHNPDGPVKKAAEPGKIAPPLNPNNPTGVAPVAGKVRKMGPKTDGTKVPDKDNRPKGRRHGQAFYEGLIDNALSRLL